MKRHLLILTAVFLCMSLTSCYISLDGETVEGNGVVVTRNYDVTSFAKFINSLPATVNFTIADDYTCTIRTDENFFDYMEIKVRNGKLLLGKPKDYNNIVFQPTEFVIDITAPSLNEANLAGSGELIFLSPLNEKDLEVKTAGTANVVFKEEVNIDHLELSVAGAGDIYLEKGKIRELETLVAGSGKIVSHAEVQDMEADVAGSGDITAKVNGTLKYFIAGSGDIKYYGDAKVDGKIAGSGNISRIDAPSRLSDYE